MPNTPIDPFLTEPALTARREELRIFAGPNPQPFLSAFDKMVEQRTAYLATKKFKFGQNAGFTWQAMILGPVWFFYRKMWVYGWGISVGLIVLGLIPGVNHVSFPVGIMLGLLARRAYVDHAMRQIDTLHAAGTVSPISLAATGGVSPKAAWISGSIVAVLFLLNIIFLILHGPSAR
ncbi:MAG: DUF2628 domain-containing protein [Janthinobacterium lividum]